MTQESQEWYVNALEKLSPLRFLMFHIIEQIESHNRFQKTMGYPELKSKNIDDAKAAMDAANAFFSSGKNSDKITCKCSYCTPVTFKGWQDGKCQYCGKIK